MLEAALFDSDVDCGPYLAGVEIAVAGGMHDELVNGDAVRLDLGDLAVDCPDDPIDNLGIWTRHISD